MEKAIDKKPKLVRFLLVWQIIEIVGLVFTFMMMFFLGVILPSGSSIEETALYPIIFIGVFLVIKVIVRKAMKKKMLWAVYFNLLQNAILMILLFASFFGNGNKGVSILFILILLAPFIGFIKAIRLNY
ncbi:MAG: hypothetical protein DRJ07_05230 [Bacteroidetes bacterium]|nr:MAG: hypothetical protein DRJ07_05230 [Bacteroidota bacterium]